MLESEQNSPEREETPPETDGKSQIETLADMFREEEPEEGGAEGRQTGEPDESPPTGKPKSLKELAKRLELADKDLYAIEVPLDNGETRTLGQIKDEVKQQDALTVRELEFEERRAKSEGALIQAQNELRELVQSLPKSALKPEVLEAIRQKQDLTTKRERAATLEVIPEWRDETVRTEELAGMVEHLQEQGLPPTFLGTVVDHRIMRYIRTNWMREKRLRAALEKVKAKPDKTPGKSKPNGAAPKKPAQSPTRQGTPRSRLLDLLSD